MRTHFGVPETIYCHFCLVIQVFTVIAILWRLLSHLIVNLKLYNSNFGIEELFFFHFCVL